MIKYTPAIICGFIGALLCAYQNEWFIICFPVKKQTVHNQISANHKNIVLTWWHDCRWHTESVDMVWPAERSRALEMLTHTWLTVVHEEHEEKGEHKHALLQTGMLSAPGTIAYLSFDRNPFDRQLSIYDKLRWIEGLSKTLCANGLSCTYIQVLVHHKPLLDAHLDFSKPWSITECADSVS